MRTIREYITYRNAYTGHYEHRPLPDVADTPEPAPAEPSDIQDDSDESTLTAHVAKQHKEL